MQVKLATLQLHLYFTFRDDWRGEIYCFTINPVQVSVQDQIALKIM